MTDLIAYDARHPYCPCGAMLERPDAWTRPSEQPVSVFCRLCHNAVLAVFWRRQAPVAVARGVDKAP